MRRVVCIDPGPGTHGAEKDVLRWIDHDSYVPTPNRQIPGLRMGYPLKLIGSDIEIRGTRVQIVEPSPFIYRVYEVRTIAAGTYADVGVECSSNHSQAVVRGKSPRGNTGQACANLLTSHTVRRARASSFLNFRLCR
jgi:hypothetical protein